MLRAGRVLARPASRALPSLGALRLVHTSAVRERSVPADFVALRPKGPDAGPDLFAPDKADAPTAWDGANSVLGRYGIYPLIGLGTTALVSKEILFLDAELLLAFNFCAFFTTAYIAAGDSVSKFFDGVRDAEKKKVSSMTEYLVAAAKVDLDVWQKKLMEPAVVEDYRTQLKTVNKDWATAQVTKSRHAVTTSMLKQLQSIKASEVREANMQQEALVSDAVTWVMQQLAQGDAKNSAASLDFAIEYIGQGEPVKTNIKTDVVKRLFHQYFTEVLPKQK